MLRLIGLIVVVLLVLSLAHGERTGSTYAHTNARAESLVDQFTSALADGLRNLGDMVFGPGGGEVRGGNINLRDVARSFDGLARSADGASRRALAQAVLRSCPSLGLVCQPAPGGVADDQPGAPRRPLTDQ